MNWRVDPLQHYRPATYPPLLVEPGRFRLPGIARHTRAEMVIAGTSVSRNQQPAEMQRIFGRPAVNLAMDGASAHEQARLLRLALRPGAVREVIWDINYEYLRGDPTWVSDFDGAFPAYLYDDSPWNDVSQYLLSFDTCKNTARILAGQLGFRSYTTRNPESFQAFDTQKEYGPAAIAAAMERRKRGSAAFRALLPQFTPTQLRVSFEQNHVALIRQFPAVTFRLYFPPFSQTYFDFLRETAPELLPVFVQHRRDVFEAVRALPNVELHDPQSDVALISDATHYADPIHFDAETHVRLLEGIRDQRWRATSERLESFRTWLKQ